MKRVFSKVVYHSSAVFRQYFKMIRGGLRPFSDMKCNFWQFFSKNFVT